MPQIHQAVALILATKWHDSHLTNRQLQRLIENIEYHQHRNAQSRTSHNNATLAALERQGINPAIAIQCGPPT